jgi:uncharacterized membrane protein
MIRRELFFVLVVIAMFVASLLVWPSAPEIVPVHWGINGQADGYGSRAMGLLLLPAVTAVIWGLTAFLPRLDPGRANYAQMLGPWWLTRASIIGFMGVVHGASVYAILGYPLNMGAVLMPCMGLLFMVLGGVMGKIRPNYFFGVRTPWTLSSKLSWSKTHRLSGWIFVGTGLLTLLGGLYRPEVGLGAMLVGLLGTLPVIFGYSYWIWKQDPDRHSPQDTRPSA